MNLRIHSKPRCRCRWIWFGLILLAPLAPKAEETNFVAIKAGEIYPVTSAPLKPGIILIRDGKIQAIGKDVEIPKGAKVIDAHDQVVLPGLINAFTTLAGNQPHEHTISADLRALDGFDFLQDYKRFLAGGVTTVYVSPGQNRLVSGLGCVVKLAGESASSRIVRSEAALQAILGEAPKNPPSIFDPPIPPDPDHALLPAEKQLPSTRMAEISVLRQALCAAKNAPEASTNRGLALALAANIPLRIRCETVPDIRNALALAREFNLKVVLEGATEASSILRNIQSAQIPVVVPGRLYPGRRQPADFSRDLANGRVRLQEVRELGAYKIPFALTTPDDAATADLLFLAGHAIYQGLSPESALAAITIMPARILGIDNRVGSLETGKDADLIVQSRSPFDLRATVNLTMINGRTVFDRSSSSPTDKPASEEPSLAIRAGRIWTASRGIIQQGLITIRQGKIVSVGPDRELPKKLPVIDARQQVVIPGLIDIHSYLGLHVDQSRITVGAPQVPSGPKSPETRRVSLAHAIDFQDPAFQEVLESGVTSVLLAPPPQNDLVCGQAAVIKLAGDTSGQRLVRECAAISFSMESDRARLGRIWEARELFKRAKEYVEQWERYEQERDRYQDRVRRDPKSDLEEPKHPQRNPQFELMKSVLQRRLPVLVHAERSDEIHNAIQVFQDEQNLELILVGAADVHRVLEEIHPRRMGVAIGPDILVDLKGRPIHNARMLAELGVPVAFQTSATSGTQFLLMQGAYAVHNGMDTYQALQAMTCVPASLLHLEDRLGSIEPGRDADLVILTGDPFEFSSRIDQVLVDGKLVFQRQVAPAP